MSVAKAADCSKMSEGIPGSPTVAEQSPTDASTLDHEDEKAGFEERVSQSKHDASLDEPHSGSPALNEQASWKSKAFQFAPIRHTVSAVAPYDPGQNGSQLQGQALTRPWRSAFIRFGPLSGILCMFIAAAGIIASLGILSGSDGALVANWTAPPSTYLAICTAIANLAMRFAAIQGVVIAWWYRASRGSTLAKLHHDWRSGTTLLGALTSGRHAELLALACISSTLVVIDGPLLQRSSTVVSAPIVNQTVPLSVTMAPELPRSYSGFWATAKDYGFPSDTGHSPAFNNTIPAGNGKNISNLIFPNAGSFVQAHVTDPWMTDASLPGVVHGCPGVCKAKILAPALSTVSCTEHVLPTNYTTPYDTDLAGIKAPPLDRSAFFISTGFIPGEREGINLVSGYAETGTDCEGDIHYIACTYESAIGEYEVTIDNGLVRLDKPASPSIVALANNTAVEPWDPTIPGHHSTLAGLAYLSWLRWDSFVNYYPAKNGQLQFYQVGGIVTSQFITGGSEACPSYRDAHKELYSSLNKLAVYIGALAASQDPFYAQSHLDKGLQINATITGYVHGSHSTYHTDYWFFLAAVLVEVACICLVAPTYWGWWNLGRPTSFSPLEMAKAFESPMLANVNSNSSGRDIARGFGDVRVKYGTKMGDPMHGNAKLASGDPAFVNKPAKGARFDV